MAKCAPQQQSIYAKEGTAAHSLAEKLLKAKRPIHADNFIGEEFNGVKVSQDMANAVQTYVEFIHDQLTEVGKGAVLYVEEKFVLDYIDPRLYGRNDCCIIEPFGRLYVYDYKHGQGSKVEVKDNPQLLFYALGAVHTHKLDFSELVMSIVQPRVSSGKGVASVTISREELAAFEKKLRERLAIASQPNAELQAGNWCKFCPAKPDCPAIKKEVETKAIAEFVASPLTPPKPETLTKEDRIRVLKYADMAEDFIASVKAYCLEDMKAGELYPGFKIVQKRVTREWADEEAAKAHFQSTLGKAAFSKPELLSPAQMEKVFGGKKGKEEVKPFVIKKSSGVSLAPEDDPRPAVSSLTAEFTALPDEGV